jgi:uncharacterized protein YoxC
MGCGRCGLYVRARAVGKAAAMTSALGIWICAFILFALLIAVLHKVKKVLAELTHTIEQAAAEGERDV